MIRPIRVSSSTPPRANLSNMQNTIAWFKVHQAKVYMVIVGLSGIAYSLGWINATEAGVVAAAFGAGTGVSLHQTLLNVLAALVASPTPSVSVSSSTPVPPAGLASATTTTNS